MGYTIIVIENFKHKGLEKFFYTGSKKGIQPGQAQKLAEMLITLTPVDSFATLMAWAA